MSHQDEPMSTTTGPAPTPAADEAARLDAKAAAAERDIDLVMPYQADPARRHHGDDAKQFLDELLGDDQMRPPGRPAGTAPARGASPVTTARLGVVGERLRAYSQRHGIDQSVVIRAALEQYLPRDIGD